MSALQRTGRPRSDKAERAVIAAAYQILVEQGLGKFSIDAVATRSGVARTTIYRRWPTKGILAIASFLEAFRSKLVYADSGSAVADLHAIVGSLAAALSGPDGRVAASVIAEAQSDSETRRLFVEQFVEPLRAETTVMLRRGIANGQFRADLDLATVIEAEVGAIYLRLLLGQPLAPDWVDRLADTLLTGCLAKNVA